ncbi:hypothetical protein [Demequina sp. NBRC 110052]|uniref:hypothetical protein n=1 Tax=Demequina sp. NBRC 110052 TaxID=1570341 RepID=UPI000A07992C|nr:hypothetical protein [Demequina sp. NBRC 110052]
MRKPGPHAARAVVALALASGLAACAPTAPDATTEPTDASGVPDAQAEVTEIVSLSAPIPGYVDVVALGAAGQVDASTNGQSLGAVTLIADEDGTLIASISSPIVGAQTFCLADQCGRVYVTDPEAQTPEAAAEVAQTALDEVLAGTGAATTFPDWTFVVGSQMSGVGGTTDAERRIVTINATPGRTHEEYVLTVRHEIGHVIDVEAMDDALRAEYLAIRGLPPDTRWSRGAGEHPTGDARWHYGEEDFAELVATLMSGGSHVPRDSDFAAAPTRGELEQIRELIDPDGTLASLWG